ncbi:hypothetical protein DYU05_07810 [Mucilaginibacter terrenus]|uniref:Alpha-2-macroglobulin domain-containing protein n=1 Tax=Mucilaginibacter terrenus TaxID=2482727 RepID=A0A3E2NWX2_9SPHI|nr:alpha-2-macroglobulin family protein [Mucilaginibacter terrenus]RFZ85492.1 hypothetical protein DYU05_07810 [Mucilaginibacter terrenus]
MSTILRPAFVTVIILLGSITAAFAQRPLTNSRQSSYYTYIYSLSPAEVEKFYTSPGKPLNQALLRNAADSFLTDKGNLPRLPNGNYLKVFALQNQLKYSLLENHSAFLQLFLTPYEYRFTLTNKQGAYINGAAVTINGNQVAHDEASNTWHFKRTGKRATLRVDYAGVTNFFNLEKEEYYSSNYSSFKYRLLRFWNKIKAPFTKHRRSSYNQRGGFMIFNKPMYKPGDTVKFKAFILQQNGKPVTQKKLLVKLNDDGNTKLLGKVDSYRAGGFEYSFVLTDSLDLDLDDTYKIDLVDPAKTRRAKANEDDDNERDGPAAVLMSGNFKYQEYELKSIHFAMRTDKEDHYPGDPLVAYFKASDENDLPVADGRVVLTLLTSSASNYKVNHVFVPDTLWQHKFNLDPVGETKLTIPDSIFPKATVSYQLEAKFMNSNNEGQEQQKEATFYYEKYRVKTEVVNDSLKISHLVNGKSVSSSAMVSALNVEGDTLSKVKLMLPGFALINPNAAEYNIATDSTDTDVELKDFTGDITLSSERTADSVFVNVANPRKLHFFYSVFENGKLTGDGQADQLNYKTAVSSRVRVTFIVNYIWGGKMKSAQENSIYQERLLTINVRQPVSVYPGQKVKTDIVVTDAQGKPVPNTDVTAWAITRKFNSGMPYVPYLGKNYPGAKRKPTYRLQDAETNGTTQLDWLRWKNALGLDSIEYFRFTHPNKIYRIEEPGVDTITQIAPFITGKAGLAPVHALYIDHLPVYFSQAQQLQPYSFKVEAGYHHLKLRTAEEEIEIDSVLVRKSKKLILSVNADAYPVTKKKDTLDTYEAALINKYMVTIANNFDGKRSMIVQHDRLFFLNPYNAAPRSILVGPLSNSYTLFDQQDKKQLFVAEPSYTYLFEPGLIKQKSIPTEFAFSRYLRVAAGTANYRDYVLTNAAADDLWQDYLDKRSNTQQLFENSHVPYNERGKLELQRVVGKNEHPVLIKNIIFYRYNDPDFIRVYPGNSTNFADIATGVYRIFYLLKNDSYDIKECIEIRKGGRNYYSFAVLPVHAKDSVSIKIAAIINKRNSIIYRNDDHGIENDALRLKEAFNEQYYNTKEFTSGIHGKVTAADDKLPVVGATVKIKGTNVATTCDVNGMFHLTGPSSGKLVVSFLGYHTQEVTFASGVKLNIVLTASSNQLNEVVVVGYGSVRKKDLAGSVTTINSMEMALQGKVAGIQVVMDSTGAPGSGFRLLLRGNASVGTKKPLYIIDGEIAEDLKGIAPSDIAEINVLKDAAATAIYGARAANGVIVITRKQKSGINGEPLKAAGQNSEEQLPPAVRKNFSDYAYWQPKLTTDENGKASFTTVFPDDITNWKTFVVGINDKKQTGFLQKEIKSFKPLSANFIAPQFAVEGDEMNLIGKVMNYNSAAAQVSRTFNYNGKMLKQDVFSVKNAKIDTLNITATATDSLEFEYSIKRDNGYTDGERRKVPVFRQGVTETKGTFEALNADTTVTLKFDPTLGPVTFRAEASALPALAEEARKLREYKYLCNEQLASKLKGLLAEKRIRTFLGEPFKYERNVADVIKKLLENRRTTGAWGWWKDSNEELWISLHALEALTEAKNMGYSFVMDTQKLTDYLVYQLESYHGQDKLTCLQLLYNLKAKVDYVKYLGSIAKENKLAREVSTYDKLKLMLLRQQTGLKVNTDSLLRTSRSTLFGNLYWGEENYRFFDNSIQISAIIYQIIKAEGKHQNVLAKIRGYFLEQRKGGDWRNTYEASTILETILPDLLKVDRQIKPAVITLKGSSAETVTRFPYTATLPAAPLTVSKTGSLPVYITGYQQFWDSKPEKVSKDFRVDTHFERNQNTLTRLKGGESVQLKAEVTIRADAEYVMIEIPIPAGCSYEKKDQQWSNNEAHREYFKDRVSIFCRKLIQGTYTFTVDLMPRYSGRYTLNPAKAEQMYFPVFYGREGIKKLVIGD